MKPHDVFSFQKSRVRGCEELKENALHSKQAAIFKNPLRKGQNCVFMLWGYRCVFKNRKQQQGTDGSWGIGSQLWGNILISRERLEENKVLKMG